VVCDCLTPASLTRPARQDRTSVRGKIGRPVRGNVGRPVLPAAMSDDPVRGMSGNAYRWWSDGAPRRFYDGRSHNLGATPNFSIMKRQNGGTAAAAGRTMRSFLPVTDRCSMRTEPGATLNIELGAEPRPRHRAGLAEEWAGLTSRASKWMPREPPPRTLLARS